jgi:hypothetical protein
LRRVSFRASKPLSGNGLRGVRGLAEAGLGRVVRPVFFLKLSFENRRRLFD